MEMKAKLKREIDRIIKEKGHIRRNGRQASERTVDLTIEAVYGFYNRLALLGRSLENPANTTQEHIRMVVYDWFHGVAGSKLANKTMQNNISRLRQFMRMLGKPGFIRKLESYLPDVDPKDLQTSSVTEKSKSLSGQGINVLALMEKAAKVDERLEMMLRGELAFGLRREEAIKFMPHVQGHDDHIAILPGQGKGGRTRIINLISDFQRQTLNYLKSKTKGTEYLGWETNNDGSPASLIQNLKRYSNLMNREMRIKGHSLRAQFSENNAIMHGIIPPALGGSRHQKDRTELRAKIRQLSEDMGHGRERVMTAYYGSFPLKKDVQSDYFIDRIIERYKEAVNDSVTVPEHRLQDVLMIVETVKQQGISLTNPQAYTFWLKWSERCGHEWVHPDCEISTCVLAGAVEIRINEDN